MSLLPAHLCPQHTAGSGTFQVSSKAVQWHCMSHRGALWQERDPQAVCRQGNVSLARVAAPGEWCSTAVQQEHSRDLYFTANLALPQFAGCEAITCFPEWPASTSAAAAASGTAVAAQGRKPWLSSQTTRGPGSSHQRSWFRSQTLKSREVLLLEEKVQSENYSLCWSWAVRTSLAASLQAWDRPRGS